MAPQGVEDVVEDVETMKGPDSAMQRAIGECIRCGGIPGTWICRTTQDNWSLWRSAVCSAVMSSIRSSVATAPDSWSEREEGAAPDLRVHALGRIIFYLLPKIFRMRGGHEQDTERKR